MTLPPPRTETTSAGARVITHEGLARPFLKWAGGKRQLLPLLRRFYPASFERYWEPFLGSGAVFFDLHASGRLRGHTVRLLDGNPDLIACYRAVRDEPEAVVRALGRLAVERASDPAGHYYDVRDRRFNPQRLAHLERSRGGLRYTPELAAMLIYLNRTGFNGLFRLNARGAFNVPIGRYARPRVCDPDNIRRVSAALRRRHLSLQRASFERVLDEARTGDFLYFDPPYAPLSPTARFTAYTAGGFGPDEQCRLQQVVITLARRGCSVLLSNSSAREIRELYDRDPAARRAGLRCRFVPARRAINAKAAGRGPVDELLVTNIAEASRSAPPARGASARRIS